MNIAVTTYVLRGKADCSCDPDNPTSIAPNYPPGTIILGGDALPLGGYGNGGSLAVTNDRQDFPLENGVPDGGTPRAAWWSPQDNIGTLTRFHMIFVDCQPDRNVLATYIDSFAGDGDLRITIFTAWD